MKKKILYFILCGFILISLAGCGKTETKTETEEEETTKTSNSIINIDGIYLNNEYTDDENLKQIILFYTITADEENLDISSSQFILKINKNEYTAVNSIETPDLTQYYYSNIIKDVYVGNSLKVAAIYKVASGDVESQKTITLEDSDDYGDGIKMKTDDIKAMDNLTAISLDVDKEYATAKQEEEKEKLTAADEATTKKVKNDINGYYFNIPAYIGTTYATYKLEFSSPNKFTITLRMSGNTVTNSGTYTVTKGYIVIHYDTNNTDVNIPYRYENGDITIDSPFYSNGSDTTF